MMSIPRIGTSGWAYRHWRQVFYPPRFPQRKWFEFYAGSFDTVELNVTFYRMPSLSTFQSWKARAPTGFLFAVKGSRYISHLKRLSGVKPSLQYFFDRVDALGDRCGPILWQLPPNFERIDERLQAFLEELPDGYRHAFEFRHPSWFVESTFALLSARNAALCIADSPSRPPFVRLTANWTYLRFHEGMASGSYTDPQLAEWSARITDFRKRDVDVYAYFNNDPGGNAIHNARRLKEMVNGSEPERMDGSEREGRHPEASG